MVDVIIANILAQLIYFIGVVFVVGFIISLLNRLFYKIVKHNRIVCYATGFIGTPVHELSHALLCLIFFHKITEIKLFQIDSVSGVLGYVNHSYNKKNIYQQIGNYFIGIAPILCGTAIIYFATKFLLPNSYSEIKDYLNDLAALQNNGLSWKWFIYTFAALGGMLQAILAGITTGYLWWIYILILFCIALHMNLSGADIKGSCAGLPFVVIILVAANFMIGFFFNPVYTGFVSVLNVAGSYMTGTLLLSLIFSAICIMVGAIIRSFISLGGVLKKLRK